MGLRRKRPTGKACWARPGPKPKAKNEPSAHGAPQGTAHDQRSWARRSRKSPRLPLEPTARVYVRRRGNVVPEETYVHERRRRENTNVAYVRPRPSPKEMGSSERSEEIRNVRSEYADERVCLSRERHTSEEAYERTYYTPNRTPSDWAWAKPTPKRMPSAWAYGVNVPTALPLGPAGALKGLEQRPLGRTLPTNEREGAAWAGRPIGP